MIAPRSFGLWQLSLPRAYSRHVSRCFSVAPEVEIVDKRKMEVEGLRSADDVWSYYTLNRSQCRGSDICRLLYILAGEMERSTRDEKITIVNHKCFMRILNDLIRYVDTLPLDSLVAVPRTLVRLNWRDMGLFKHIESPIMTLLPSMTTNQIAEVTRAYADVQAGGKAFWESIINNVAHRAGEFAPGDFANVCVAMTRKSSHKPVHFLKGAYPFLLHQMQRRAHKIADVVRILRVYARWPSGLMKQTTMIVAITAQLSVEALTGLADQELAQVLASLASLCGSREYPYREGTAVFHRAEPVIISRISAMDHGSLSRIVFAYNVHGLGDGRLYRLLLDRGLEVVSAMSPRQLSNCLKVFGEQLCSRKVQRTEGWSSEHHDGKMSPSTSTTEPTWFYDAAEATVVRKIREFKSLDVVETIVGYAHARTGSTQLWAVLVEATNHRITIFNAEQASMLCWAFAVVRTGAKLFPQLQVTALERLNQFSAFGLTNMLWAFAVMKKLDPDFCEPILAVLTPEVVSSDSRCALLFPTLRELQAVHSDFDPAGTERYLEYCRAHFWDLQLSTAPSDELMTSISDTLVQIERPGVGMYDFDGFLVDMWVPGIKAAILVSTRANMQARSQTPTGEAILRHRHVMRGTRGRVIHVWDQEWNEMDGQERATFLRERLDRWYEEDQNVERGQETPEGSTESVPAPKRIAVEPIPGEVELLKKLQERMKEEVEIGNALTPGLCAGSPQEMARNIRRQRRAAKRWKEIDTPEDEPARLPWEAKMWVKERKTRHGEARGSK